MRKENKIRETPSFKRSSTRGVLTRTFTCTPIFPHSGVILRNIQYTNSSQNYSSKFSKLLGVFACEYFFRKVEFGIYEF